MFDGKYFLQGLKPFSLLPLTPGLKPRPPKEKASERTVGKKLRKELSAKDCRSQRLTGHGDALTRYTGAVGILVTRWHVCKHVRRSSGWRRR